LFSRFVHYKVMRQVDKFEVRTNQLEFRIRNREQQYIPYRFPAWIAASALVQWSVRYRLRNPAHSNVADCHCLTPSVLDALRAAGSVLANARRSAIFLG